LDSEADMPNKDVFRMNTRIKFKEKNMGFRDKSDKEKAWVQEKQGVSKNDEDRDGAIDPSVETDE
jgi:hypothetical protein